MGGSLLVRDALGMGDARLVVPVVPGAFVRTEVTAVLLRAFKHFMAAESVV
jgi:hypothetical protein